MNPGVFFVLLFPLFYKSIIHLNLYVKALLLKVTNMISILFFKIMFNRNIL